MNFPQCWTHGNQLLVIFFPLSFLILERQQATGILIKQIRKATKKNNNNVCCYTCCCHYNNNVTIKAAISVIVINYLQLLVFCFSHLLFVVVCVYSMKIMNIIRGLRTIEKMSNK